MKVQQIIVHAVFLILACTTSAMATDAAPLTADDLPQPIFEQMSAGNEFAQLEKRVARVIQQVDRNGDGLDKRDIEIVDEMRHASSRAQQAMRMISLDLDGDGKLTRDEVVETLPARPHRTEADVARDIDRIMQFDLNGDNVVTLDEALTLAPDTIERLARPSPAAAFLAYDTDKDGRLSDSELKSVLTRTFDLVDTNHDKIISTEEFKTANSIYRQGRSTAWTVNRQALKCVLPKPAADDQIILYSTHEGQMMSPVAIGERDFETTSSIVNIDAGNAPLYLILNSYDRMIFDFTGDISRVSHVVVMGRRAGNMGVMSPPGSGATRIPKEKLTFIDSADCFQNFSDTKSLAAVTARGVVTRVLGREPTEVAAAYSTRDISLPSLTSDTMKRDIRMVAPKGFDEKTWRSASLYYPAGLATIDAKDVTGPAPAIAYDVLPSGIGISQLVGSGALVAYDDYFKIVKPIARFPAGLGGAHAVRFVLAKGVPMPKGDSGHSCVISEATGLSVGSSTALCRGN